MQIQFRVYGIPKPGGSKRAFVARGKVIVKDDCKQNRQWRDSVIAAAEPHFIGREPLDCPLELRVVFIMPRPQGHYRTGRNAGALRESAPTHHTSKPDATKLMRSTEDALTGILWRDDSRIARQTVEKRYGVNPGAEITITTLE